MAKHFKDKNGMVWEFEDHVAVLPHPDIEGALQFLDVNGHPMSMIPHDLMPHTLAEPTLKDHKEAARARLRVERGPLLLALDVQYMRADEEGDTATKAAVVAEKKRLRDITSLVDAATSPEELEDIEL
jgi:hypothetical protein